MAKKATADDAQLILRLYDLRREAEMRKARYWWLTAFWPESADDVLAVMRALGTQENNWYRQVLGYWGIATSLALNGAVSETLFLEPSFCGEMFIIFCKMKPFVKELREKVGSPLLLKNIETMVLRTKASREWLKYMEKNVVLMREARNKQVASQGGRA
jgi:hypothetical protein